MHAAFFCHVQIIEKCNMHTRWIFFFLGAQTILPKKNCNVDILRSNMHIVIESIASKIFTNSPSTPRKEGAKGFAFCCTTA
jgi:hypothetical protein